MFTEARSPKVMVALVTSRHAHAHDKLKRAPKTEEALAAETSVQEAEHHNENAARLGVGGLTVT